MFVNKQGRLISNIGTPTLEFDTPEDYQDWKESLPASVNPDDFFVILNYTPDVGSYVEAKTLSELNGLPQEMKKVGVLYGASEEDILYHYDATNNIFRPFVF